MLYILNTTILTTPGLSYDSEVITAERAQRYVQNSWAVPRYPSDVDPAVVPYVSGVGHESTAAIASTILGVPVPMSRTAIAMRSGDIAICIKLRGRPPEGTILSREQVEAIGYDLVLLTARDPADRHQWADKMMRVAALLCSRDDGGEGEQQPGTRRPGKYPMQAHFVVRLETGEYRSVTQEWGTDAWDVREISAEQAKAEMHHREPRVDDRMSPWAGQRSTGDAAVERIQAQMDARDRR